MPWGWGRGDGWPEPTEPETLASVDGFRLWLSASKKKGTTRMRTPSPVHTCAETPQGSFTSTDTKARDSESESGVLQDTGCSAHPSVAQDTQTSKKPCWLPGQANSFTRSMKLQAAIEYCPAIYQSTEERQHAFHDAGRESSAAFLSVLDTHSGLRNDSVCWIFTEDRLDAEKMPFEWGAQDSQLCQTHSPVPKQPQISPGEYHKYLDKYLFSPQHKLYPESSDRGLYR
ncbi:hypothetical protein MJG53_018992 [Ovis ammon polii x Ovis aries]|uniref:Uncharacterized protein n=1 Tax=Ovis ammon polii x Ovis aries TaxID=2918886 RepID=A0ACB9U3S3_9CETA|nr:hypothetical protein MJG53_018992 [Ovis ammon polii x Ovis aries]